MSYTKVYYENLINNAPLFTLSKECRKNAFLQKKALVAVLLEYTKRYLLNDYENAEYSLEIIGASSRCIKSYVKESEEFLHYYNRVFKNWKYVARLRRNVEEALKKSEVVSREEKLTRTTLHFALSKNKDIHSVTIQTSIARALDIPLRVVQEYVEIEDNALTKNQRLIEIKTLENSSEVLDEVQEDMMDDDAFALEAIELIERGFVGQQERVKAKLRKIITTDFLNSVDISPKLYAKLYVMEWVSVEILSSFIEGKTTPTSRQIAAEFRVKETDISRAKNRFYEKIRFY